VHKTHFSFHHDIVACPVPVWAGLAVACDGGIDQRGVNLGDGFVVELVFFEGTGEVVFDEDVTFLDEGVEDGYPAGVVEGETKGLFVAVYLW
jgi:hypothetical protein